METKGPTVYVETEPRFSQLITNWSIYEDDLIVDMHYWPFQRLSP
jgi:hypothetical protein